MQKKPSQSQSDKPRKPYRKPRVKAKTTLMKLAANGTFID